MRVLTVGVFDGLHTGHLNILERAATQGDYLVVGVQSDAAAARTKDMLPVMALEARLRLVQAIRFVDETVAYDNVDELVRQVNLDVFVTGEDQIHKGFQDAEAYCRQHDIRVIRLPRTPGISSTILRENPSNST
ncbi:adenylyltransferase/cytidyltransferase family protein [Candidatus Neomarinimicrobiota bacterium]